MEPEHGIEYRLQHYGSFIRSLLEQHGISSEDFSAATAIPNSVICDVMTGAGNLEYKTVQCLENGFLEQYPKLLSTDDRIKLYTRAGFIPPNLQWLVEGLLLDRSSVAQSIFQITTYFQQLLGEIKELMHYQPIQSRWDSERLKLCRKQYRMTQQEVADALGVTRVTVNRWENQRISINPAYSALLEDLFSI